MYGHPGGMVTASLSRKVPVLGVPGLVLAALLLFQGCTGAGDSGIPAPPPPSSAGETPALGANASLQGARPFPADNPWNTPIDSDPVDPDSDLLIDSIGRTATLHPDFGADWDGGPFGIPYVVVSGDTPKVPVSFQYADESDAGPYPIPPGAPIEGGRLRKETGTYLWSIGTTGSSTNSSPPTRPEPDIPPARGRSSTSLRILFVRRGGLPPTPPGCRSSRGSFVTTR